MSSSGAWRWASSFSRWEETRREGQAESISIQQEVREGVQGTEEEAPSNTLCGPRKESTCKSEEDEVNG